MWLPLCCSIVKGSFLLMIYLESMPWWSPPGGRPLVVAQYASPFAASPCHPEPQRRVCLHGPPDASPLKQHTKIVRSEDVFCGSACYTTNRGGLACQDA